MLDTAPGQSVPTTSSEDLSAGLAQSAPALAPAAPESAPVAPPSPVPGGPGAVPVPAEPGSPAGPSDASAPTAPSAPAAPAGPSPFEQAQAQLQQYGTALEQQGYALQQQRTVLQARAQDLAALIQATPEEQREPLYARAQYLLQEDADVQRRFAEAQQAYHQLGYGQKEIAMKAREAELERLAAPMSVHLLVQKAMADTPGIDPADMAQVLSGYDANHLMKAHNDYLRGHRARTLQQRAAAGTDHMGGASPGAAPPNPNSSGTEDIQAYFAGFYANGIPERARRG
jgi:hypothetical protein